MPRPRSILAIRALVAIGVLERARRCAGVRARTPNLLAVDFSERGDVIGAAKVLNDERR